MRLIIILIFLSACSSSNLLKRAEKLIQKAEAKGAKWSVDTVMKEIPVFIKEFHTDTVVQAVTGDTIFINKERVRIKFVKLPKDSVFIDIKLPADTIIKEVPVQVIKTIEAKPKYPWWVFLSLGFILGIVILFFLLKSFKNS